MFKKIQVSHQLIPNTHNYPLRTLLQNVFGKPVENTELWPVEFNELFPSSRGRSSVFYTVVTKSLLLIKSTHFFLLAVCSFLLLIGIEKKPYIFKPWLAPSWFKSKKLQASLIPPLERNGCFQCKHTEDSSSCKAYDVSL